MIHIPTIIHCRSRISLFSEIAMMTMMIRCISVWLDSALVSLGGRFNIDTLAGPLRSWFIQLQ